MRARRTLLVGMWPSAMEAWDWMRTEFDPKTFPGGLPVPVRVEFGDGAMLLPSRFFQRAPDIGRSLPSLFWVSIGQTFDEH